MLKQILLSSLICLTGALTLPVDAQTSFYGHDRGWKHGHVVNGSTVPDDYLVQTQAPSGEITRSTPPFGYYARKSDGKVLTQNRGVSRPIVINGRSNNSTLIAAPNDCDANGMGGAAFGGNDFGYLNDDPYAARASANSGRPSQRQMRTVRSTGKPRVIYYSGQPAFRWGSAMNHQPLLPGSNH